MFLTFDSFISLNDAMLVLQISFSLILIEACNHIINNLYPQFASLQNKNL